MIDEARIRTEYSEHNDRFVRVKDDFHDVLKRIAQAFYQKRKFKVIVLEPRLKGLDSTIGKIKRKGLDGESLFKEEPEQMSLVVNDFLGARISCNTREDVAEIADLIKQNRRFKLVKEELLNKPSGYRALHLDMLFEVHWYDKLISIPVEIQIKTHLQTAWGDITHDESYKPDNEAQKNEHETAFSKHMADMLDVLDEMASTIRAQRLSYVTPPAELDDEDINITPTTLSYKISKVFPGSALTQQEMGMVIDRLRQEGFASIAEVHDLLTNPENERKVKLSKEALRNNENVSSFEILFYGALLKNFGEDILAESMRKDYGFVDHLCESCSHPLSEAELKFLNEKTDAELRYFCEDHRGEYLVGNCKECGLLTSGELCKNCAANTIPF